MINKLRWPIFTRRARAARAASLPYIIPYRDSVSADNSNRLVPRPTTRNDAFNARQNFSPLIGRARARGERGAHLAAAPALAETREPADALR